MPIAVEKNELPRYINKDGMTSLRKQFFAPHKEANTLFGLWRSKMKPEVYPLVIILGGAIGLAGAFAARHLFTNPDVQLNKLRRQQTVKEHFETGRQWVRHRESLRNPLFGPSYIKFSDVPATPKQA